MFRLDMSLLRERLFGLVNLCFGVFFIIQMSFIIGGHIWPVVTNTVAYQQTLNAMDFPAEFKICVQPGFVKEELFQAGYKDLEEYFHGQSRLNSSIFGWAGHFLVKENISAEGNFYDLLSTIIGI